MPQFSWNSAEKTTLAAGILRRHTVRTRDISSSPSPLSHSFDDMWVVGSPSTNHEYDMMLMWRCPSFAINQPTNNQFITFHFCYYFFHSLLCLKFKQVSAICFVHVQLPLWRFSFQRSYYIYRFAIDIKSVCVACGRSTPFWMEVINAYGSC